MANTTDPHGSKPGTDLYGRGELDAKTDTGPGHGHAVQHGVETGEFDREINVRGILWSGVWLTVGTLAFALLMWWFLRGIQTYDEHHEVKMMPMMVQNPQRPPTAVPLLQEDPAVDMVAMRKREDGLLDRAGWVDQPGGTLRVPVEVAIDAIVQRGVAPFPATGAPGAGAAGAAPTVSMSQTPLEVRTRVETANPADNRRPGATVQNMPAPGAPGTPKSAPVRPPAKPPAKPTGAAATPPPGR